MSDERRKFTRAPLAFPTRIWSEDGVVHAPAGGDVSACGISVEDCAPLPEGTVCRVEIILNEEISIAAHGHVVRSGERRMSLEFRSVEATSFDLLRSLIRFNSEDPDQIDREFDDSVGLIRKN